MKRRNRSLNLRPNTLLTDAVHFKDRSRAIADVHQALAIKSNPRREAQVARKRNRFLERIQLVNITVEPAGDEHLSIGTKRNASRIRDVARVLGNIATDVDT